jgi:hypothetical protein
MQESLAIFRNQLRRLLAYSFPLGSEVRPFVCEGSPLSCDVFLVGFNPANSGIGSFWSYWLSDYGFDKKRWLVDYKARRKSSKTSLGRTRERIHRVVAGLKPFRCLETNVYAVPSANAKALAAADRISDHLRFLIATLRPTMILVHGKPETIVLQTLMRIPPLPINRFVKTATSFGNTWICSVPHLCLVSYRDASQLGVKARHILSGSKIVTRQIGF